MAKRDRNKHKKQTAVHNQPKNDATENALDFLLKKRIGGAVNFKGIGFQVLYASFVILKYLDDYEVNTVSL
jgi:hypothetical protein